MSFGNTKQHFRVGDWVRMGNFGLSNEHIEGLIGRIGGKSFDDAVCDHYIVILSQPWPDSGAVAVTMTEACLEPLDVERWRLDSPRTMPDGSLCEFGTVPGGGLSAGHLVAA